MAERIASGEIHIEVDDREAVAALRRVEKDFDRTMSKIDRQEAEVDIKANVRDFDKEVERAKRVVRQLEGEKAEVELGIRKGDEEKLAEDIKRAKANVKSLDGLKAEIEIEVQSDLDELKRTEARIKAIEAREKALTKAMEDQDKQRKRNLKSLSDEAARRSRLETQKVRELTLAEKQARQMERERNEVPKLERSYALLQDRLEKLAQAKRKVRGDNRAVALVTLDEQQTLADLDHLRNEVHRRLGRDPISMPVRGEIARDFGTHIRAELGKHNGHLGATAMSLGTMMGQRMGHGLVGGFQRTVSTRGGNISAAVKGLGAKALAGGLGQLSKIGHALGGLSDMTVRLGPFTATIRQAVVGMSLLAPIIIDVVGALGSLISVAGAATVGVGALSAGFIGGLIPAAIAAVTVIKPVVGEFQNAMAASKAYAKAVREYGSGSDQAAKKQKILNNVLRDTDDRTRKTITAAGDLSSRWAALTKPARASTFRVMGEGLKVLTDNVGMFGAKTNTTFKNAEGSITRWFRALNTNMKGPNGGALGTMWDNFNEALPSILDGLGNIAGYLGRVGQLASSRIPGIAATFERWSEKILGTSDNMSALDQRVGKVIQAAKDVGNFFLAAGRLMKAFFAGGVSSGQSFVNTMTNAMNRWTAFLNTTHGRNELKSWFDEGVQGAQSLYATFAPVLSSFVRWAALMSPWARLFFNAAAQIGALVSQVLRLTGLRGPVAALATTLGALWAIGKISAATNAVVQFTRALLGMKAAQTGLSATAGVQALRGGFGAGVGTAAGGAAGGAAAGRGANQAASGLLRQRAAAAAAAGAMAQATASGGRFASAMAGLRVAVAAFVGPIVGGTAAIGAAAVALAYFGSKAQEAPEYLKRASAALRQGTAEFHNQGDAYRAMRPQLSDLGSQWQNATLSLKQARTALKGTKEGTDEHRMALLQYRQALAQVTRSGNDFKKLEQDMVVAADRSYAAAERRRQAWEKAGGEDQIKKQKEFVQQLKDEGASAKEVGAAQNVLNMQMARRAEILRAVEVAHNRQAAATLNAARAYRGMVELTGKAEQQLGKLARTAGGGKIAKKISLQFEAPKDAGRVAATANRALDSGLSKKRTFDVVANSKDAETAIRRLNRLTLNEKTLSILEKGGAHAIARLEQIIGRKLTPKEQKIAETGGSGVLAVLSKILGRNFTTKTQKLTERGSNAVLGAISTISSRQIRDKSFVIRATNLASGVLNDVARGLASLHDKSVTVTTHHKGNAQGGPGIAVRGREKGIMPLVPREATARGRKVNKPTLMVGEEDRTEFVIATNPAYRSSNLKYLKMAADALGVDMARKGKKAKKKKDPHLSDRGTSQAQGQARAKVKKKVPNPTSYSTENLLELADVETAKRNESNQARQISIEESKLKEPASFLTVTGQDENGDDVYAINTQAMNDWSAALKRISDMYAELMVKINSVSTAVTAALKAIGNPFKAGNDFTGVIGRTYKNEDTLQRLINSENKTINKKGASNKEKDAAKARIGIYKDAMTSEREARSAATSDWKALDDERNDIPFRYQEAQQNASEYQADSDAVKGDSNTPGSAASELKDKTPKPEQIKPDPFKGGNDRSGALEAEAALAQIGQGIGGAAPRSQSDIVADQIKAQQSIIDTGQSLLRDNDPNNDADAYTAISQAAGAIQTLQGSLPNMGQEMQNLSTARGDLMRSFGGNFSTASNFGRTAAAFSGGGSPGAFGINPATGGGNLNGVAQKVINQTNNFAAPPPDEHTWSQGVAWELGAL